MDILKKIGIVLNESAASIKSAKQKAMGLKHIAFDVYEDRNGKKYSWNSGLKTFLVTRMRKDLEDAMYDHSFNRKYRSKPKGDVSKEVIKRIADKTEGSYSYDRYEDWNKVIEALLDDGYNEREVEAILMSKWMRFADEEFGISDPEILPDHGGTATVDYTSDYKSILKFIHKYEGRKDHSIKDLVKAHFGEDE